MLERVDPAARLPRSVRERLEAFAQAVESIGPGELPLMAARPADPLAHDRARDSADEEARRLGWTDAMLAIRTSAVHWLEQHVEDPNSWWGPGVRPSTITSNVDDRVRAAQSLTDAFRAVALWDQLHEGERDELLGPWASLVEESAGEPAG